MAGLALRAHDQCVCLPFCSWVLRWLFPSWMGSDHAPPNYNHEPSAQCSIASTRAPMAPHRFHGLRPIGPWCVYLLASLCSSVAWGHWVTLPDWLETLGGELRSSQKTKSPTQLPVVPRCMALCSQMWSVSAADCFYSPSGSGYLPDPSVVASAALAASPVLALLGGRPPSGDPSSRGASPCWGASSCGTTSCWGASSAYGSS